VANKHKVLCAGSTGAANKRKSMIATWQNWSKPKANADHINVLLRGTLANRHRWITSLPAGVFMDIMAAFPCFMDGQFVFVSASCIGFCLCFRL